MDVGSFVEVVLPLAVPSLLYKLPQGIRAEVGKRVLVSLRGKARIGVILEVLSSLPPDLDPGRLKEVMEVITFISTFPPMICGIGTYTKYLSDHIHPDLWRVVSFRLNEFSSSGEVLSPDVRKHVDYYFSFPNPSLPPYCEHGLLWFQHAFGMWGNSGDHFLTLLEEGRRRIFCSRTLRRVDGRRRF